MSNCTNTKDVRLNTKTYKQSSSSFTDNKKALVVLGPSGNNISNTGPCKTSVSGPGDITASVTKCCYSTGFMGRVNGKGIGVDKKHGSYDRYLSRKKGLNILNQICQ